MHRKTSYRRRAKSKETCQRITGNITSMVKQANSLAVRKAPSLVLLRLHREAILRLAASHGVSNIRVFGSVARGDATEESDIDLLVDFTLRTSGLELIAFAQDLEDLLGYRVDIATQIHRIVLDRVEREAVSL